MSSESGSANFDGDIRSKSLCVDLPSVALRPTKGRKSDLFSLKYRSQSVQINSPIRRITAPFAKCVLLGDERVGKTCLAMSHKNGVIQPLYTPTIVNSFCTTIHVDGVPVLLSIFDTSGQKVHHRLVRDALKDARVLLICFSLVNPSSLKNVERRWLREAHTYAPNVPLILVGTMADLRESLASNVDICRKGMAPIDAAQGHKMAANIGAIKYIESSALTLAAIDELFREAARLASARLWLCLLPAIKCIVVGDEKVGKTALIISYKNSVFQHEYRPTVFSSLSFSVLIEGDNEARMSLVDTSGGSEHERLRQAAYKLSNVILICFSLVDLRSFESVEEKWVAEVRSCSSPKTKIILVGTKLDERAISYSRGADLAERIGATKYLECSALTQSGLDELFVEAAKLGAS